jgi:signal transduction histidine kinase
MEYKIFMAENSEKYSLSPSTKFFKAIGYLKKMPVLPSPYLKLWPYLSAILITGLALFCELHFRVFQETPALLLFAAVIFSTWYGGLGPGLVAIAIAMLSMDYYFIKPLYSFSFGFNYISESIVFASVALLISSLVESQRQAEETVRLLVDKQKRFVADASHELFTPLSIIKAQSEVGLQKYKDDPLGYRQILANNLEEVDHMTKIVEDLLELSRTELRAKEAPYNLIELSGLAREVLNKMRVLADEKKINGNAAELRNMVINLVHNAIKYTPVGGKIITTVLSQGNAAQLIIQDNGIGIGPEYLPYIFDPFYKTDEARIERQGGAGLGLAVVKSVVDLHKGNINIKSKINYGTTVTVEFPKA